MKIMMSHGQECWQVATPAIEASVTVRGGMMAPVAFSLPDGRVVEPYYISPWQDEAPGPARSAAIVPAVLGPLRGDFFCLPFGGGNRVALGPGSDSGASLAKGSRSVSAGDPEANRFEDHEPHGESSWREWRLVSCLADLAGDGPGPAVADGSQPAMRLILSMEYEACRGSLQKSLFFGHGQPYIGTEHVISGFSGAYPLGHHAILAGSTDSDGKWEVFMPPFEFGLTDQDNAPPFKAGEYYALEAGAEFHDFTQVPTRWKAQRTTDLSLFPARRGFIDIAAVYRKPSPGTSVESGLDWMGRIGWTVAVDHEENYLWYSIKDQSLLPATVFWMENQGRHASPWSGRNSCIGIEESCTFMASGRAGSILPNPVNQRGIPSAIHLSPSLPLSVRTIQGVLPLPQSGCRIAGLRLSSTGGGSFETEDGLELALPVSPAWVLGAEGR